MRFITEFEITEKDKEHDNWMEYLLARQKYNRQADMGTMIAETFGWINPVYEDQNRYRLCIEAFPMDKWIEFKRRLTDALPDYDTVSRVRIINALVDLESFIPKQKLPG